MHKIRLLCGSIAVTIATHKNSKIQRLSEFFLMRIGTCFATFAILSYIKIIDNNWYLSYLLSYFLLGIQWGKCNSDTIQGYPISFNEEPIVLGIHYGSQANVNIVSSGSLGDAALANCFFYHSDYNGKVQVNWIAIGL